MGRFYPKNFVLLLLLLIFLEVIYESDSPGLVRGVGAVYMDDEHYASCESDPQCTQGFRCDLIRKKCVCNNKFDYKKKILRERHAVFFNKALGKCVAPIGKVCTLDPKDGLYQIGCVPYAFCAPQKGKQLPDIFGVCQCNAGFEETEDHLCELVPVVLIPNPGRPMPSMAHRIGPPVEENMGSGSDTASNDRYNENRKPGITSEQRNQNEDIVKDSIKAGVKDWTDLKLSPKGDSQSVKCSGHLVIITLLVACFSYILI